MNLAATKQTDGAIRLIHCQRLPLIRPVVAGALGDPESLDFLLGHASLTKPAKGGERKPVTNDQRQVGLRTNDPTEHALAAELLATSSTMAIGVTAFYLVSATCCRYMQQIADWKGSILRVCPASRCCSR
ncbi:hypothetical protein AB4144_32020 [Rhizobiaceae sp. 2RAB30]